MPTVNPDDKRRWARSLTLSFGGRRFPPYVGQRLAAIVARMSGATCGAGVPHIASLCGLQAAQFCLRYAAATFRSAGNGPSTRSTSAESQYSLISLILPFSIRQTMQYWLS